MTVVSMKKLLENGVHFGHQTRRWNPKMKPYIYTAKNGVYVLNLAITQEKINEAYEAMKVIAERGGKVLFVGTKKQAQAIVVDEALRSGSFYVNQRWLGGLLTNYRTIQKRIRRLIEIEEMEANGSINIYPKKQIAQIRKEATRLDNFLGGIKEMRKLPDAVFVVDLLEDHNAVAEARKLGIPVFGLCDTNCDPDALDYIIPSNDDAVKAIKLIVGLMADAIVETKAGLLTYAHQEEEGDDITMADVIVSVDQQHEENERRRRQRNEERRAKENRRFDRNRGPRPDRPERPARKAEEVVKKEGTVTEAVETQVPVAEVVETEAPVVETVKVEVAAAEAPVVETPTAEAVKEEVVVEAIAVVEETVETPVVKEKPAAKEAPKVKKTTKKAATTEETVEKAPKAKKTTKKAEVATEEVAEKKPKAPRTKKETKTTTEEVVEKVEE